MSASWSKRTSSLKNTRAITCGPRTTGRRTIGQARAHGFDNAQGPADSRLSGLDPRADAGAGRRAGVATALGGAVPALLSSPMLPRPGLRRPPDRRPARVAPGHVFGAPRHL